MSQSQLLAAECIGTLPLFWVAYMVVACPNCRMLLVHSSRLAFSRAVLRAGRRTDIRMAMMPMTTRSSTRVKPGVKPRACLGDFMTLPPAETGSNRAACLQQERTPQGGTF